MKKIDKSVRLTNYLIDFLVILFILIMVGFFIQNQFLLQLGYFIVTFAYYFIMETIFQQTVGKIVTKTIVVNKNGEKAGFKNILLRSLVRLIPIDSFSYIFGTERGLHNVLSSTKLIKFDNKTVVSPKARIF